MKEYIILLFIVIVGVLIADAIEGFIKMAWFRRGIETAANVGANAAVPFPPVVPDNKKNEPFKGGKYKNQDEDESESDSEGEYKKKDEENDKKMGYKPPTMSPRPTKYS
jgi:hypothetical protein